ncbi:hypothetical protein DEO72_LG11g2694 [Vigna unguiculata]|uniref:Uncharacterized protein n=1 Tax=Vigna unguiculata TaxID=3917 RepID=A0A4D6NRX4_VIGUN|nr:hypothetical protein DEO72_LG5g1255 [Vigna unguiculata]QCE15681.1 hypothetical protein DEO72_LG11g2693 [Vigna unguiculata]QCE15682.1 hypothetical protein DEO72_LG11g2694 [Vigna unguiculata]
MCSLRRAPPSLRRGLKKGAEALAGSCLGETPLAWARCSLAHNHSGLPGQPFVEKGLGEPLLISPGRVYQCPPLFSPTTDAKTYHKQQSHRIIHPYQ